MISVEPKTKVCTKCGKRKPLDKFSLKDGRRYDCKRCVREYGRGYYAANREKTSEYSRSYYAANREKLKEKQRRYYADNPEKVRATQRRWDETNPEKVRGKYRRYYAANPEKLREKERRYREANREKLKEKQRHYYADNPEKMREATRRWQEANPDRLRELQRRWREANPLQSMLRTALMRHLRQKGVAKTRSTSEIFDTTMEQLRKHIEAQFLPGMNWDNFAHDGWHVDHYIPLAAIEVGSIDDVGVKLACSLANLRPLWAADNFAKHDSIPDPKLDPPPWSPVMKRLGIKRLDKWTPADIERLTN